MITNRVIPTVFALSIDEFNEKFSKLVKFASAMQIDFMDGVFVPAKSIPLSIILDLKKYKIAFEAHLMVSDPERWIVECGEKGFNTIIIHIESLKNTERGLDLIHRIRRVGARPLIAINPETSMERLDVFLKNTDGVLVMGVCPGKENQELSPNTVRRIITLKKRGLIVQVDGGVNDKTINLLVAAGVDAVNVGSYIANAKDSKGAYENLVNAFKK